MRLIDAARTYDVASRATATRETTSSPFIANFARELRRLNKALDGFEDDATWTAFTRRCRRTLRDLSITPLSSSHPVFELGESVEHLRNILDATRTSYSDDILARADLTVTALADASGDGTNPLGALIQDILSTGSTSTSGVVVKTRHLDATRAWLVEAALGVRLITEGEITGLSGLETLVVVGPSYWFPAHLLSAPRAEAVCFVHFDFLRDRDLETRMFAGDHQAPGTRIRTAAAPPNTDEEGTEVATLVPTVDWDALARASGVRHATSADDVEMVPANLFLLADGYSVYLEASDGPTIDVVVDVEPGSTPRLRSEKTRTVSVGDFVVLRSEGGSGDYIPGIADTRLGKRARELRGTQALWKEALREMVRERGYRQVDRDLRSRGVTSPNLRYRLWRNSLRSRDPNDFRILMEYVGLGDRAAQIWTAMGELFEAHLRAGQDVRKLLEGAVVATDTGQLIQTGRVDVRLSEMDAGTLSVVRVDGRAPEPTAVDEDDLRIMIRVEADLWQG